MDWKLGPPILVGEKALWMRNGKEQCLSGIIKWIGHIPELDSDWSVGMELDQPLIDGGCDGFWQTRKLFECKTKHGIVVPVNQIQKFTTKSSFRECK